MGDGVCKAGAAPETRILSEADCATGDAAGAAVVVGAKYVHVAYKNFVFLDNNDNSVEGST